MSTDAQGRSQPPQWTDPPSSPGEVFGPVPAMPPLPHSETPNGDGPSFANIPEPRPLEGLSNAQLLAALSAGHNGGPGGTRVMGSLNAQRVAQEIAHRKANGLWSEGE